MEVAMLREAAWLRYFLAGAAERSHLAHSGKPPGIGFA
jgi:hypothetical protein